MKDARGAESEEKSYFKFFRFLFIELWLFMVIFVLKAVSFRWISTGDSQMLIFWLGKGGILAWEAFCNEGYFSYGVYCQGAYFQVVYCQGEFVLGGLSATTTH